MRRHLGASAVSRNHERDSALSLEAPQLLQARQMPEVVEQALMHAFDGVAVLLDGQYIWLNEMHHAMYGYSLEESAGKSWRMLYDDDEAERIEQEIFPVLGAEGQWKGICRGRRKAGDYFDVELSLAILPTGELVCCCRDVTQRVNSERRQAQLIRFMESVTHLLQSEISAPNVSQFLRRILSLLAENLPRPCTLGIVPSGTAIELNAEWLFIGQASSKPQFVESASHLEDGMNEVECRKLAEAGVSSILPVGAPALRTSFWPISREESRLAIFVVALQEEVTEEEELFVRASISVTSTILGRNALQQEKLTLQRREQAARDDLNAVTRAAGVLRWSLDLESGEFEGSNPGLIQEFTGQESLQIKELRQLIVPDDFREVYRGFQSLLATGNLFDMQFRVQSSQGEIHVVRTIALRNFREAEISPKLTGITYDVSERHAVGERLQRLEDYYVRLFELMRDGLALLVWDDEASSYRVARMNRALAEILQLTLDGDYSDRLVAEVFPASVLACIESQMVVNATVSRPHLVELTLCGSGPASRFVRLELGRFGGGQQATVFLRGFDIDEEKRLLREQKRITELHESANEELRRASKLKDAFLANMSHELRTPLNGILGACELLASGACGSLESRQSDILAMAESAGRHLLSIISDILDLSKINSGKMQLCASTFHVGSVLENVMHFLRPVADSKDVSLLADRGGWGNIEIESDRVRLTQVLTNLLSNAVKFSPPGGEVRIEAWSNQETGNVHVQISDAGPGILPTQQWRIFCQFEQAVIGLDRPHEGTGLGLALVRSLVQMLGGRVVVSSEPGHGSRFEVVLPPALNHGHSANAFPSSLARRQPQPGSGDAPRIFIIDPLRTRAVKLERCLMQLGYPCYCFEELPGALLAAPSLSPALILLELGEPGVLIASTENVERLSELSNGAASIIGISAVVVDAPKLAPETLYGCSAKLQTVIGPPWDQEVLAKILTELPERCTERLGAS